MESSDARPAAELRSPGFDQDADLQEIVEGDPEHRRVQSQKIGEAAVCSRDDQVRLRPDAPLDLDQPEALQDPERLAHGSSAHRENIGQLPLGWQAITETEPTGQDGLFDLEHHALKGAALGPTVKPWSAPVILPPLVRPIVLWTLASNPSIARDVVRVTAMRVRRNKTPVSRISIKPGTEPDPRQRKVPVNKYALARADPSEYMGRRQVPVGGGLRGRAYPPLPQGHRRVQHLLVAQQPLRITRTVP